MTYELKSRFPISENPRGEECWLHVQHTGAGDRENRYGPQLHDNFPMIHFVISGRNQAGIEEMKLESVE